MLADFHAAENGRMISDARLRPDLRFVIAYNHSVIEIVRVRVNIGIVRH